MEGSPWRKTRHYALPVSTDSTIGLCSRAQTVCTQLVQQGIDRYQRAAQPQQGSPASETRKAHPAAKTLCFACKYMYCDWDTEPCLTCLRHTLAEAGQADAFEREQIGKDAAL